MTVAVVDFFMTTLLEQRCPIASLLFSLTRELRAESGHRPSFGPKFAEEGWQRNPHIKEGWACE
jgi:hypothetical protein